MAMRTPTPPDGGGRGGEGPRIADLIIAHGMLESMIDVIVAANTGMLEVPTVQALPRHENGIYALWVDGVYEGSLRTRDPEEAKQAEVLRRAQLVAERLNIAAPRLAPIDEIIEARKAVKGDLTKASHQEVHNSLARIEPYCRGKRVYQLDERWKAATRKALLETFAESTVHSSFGELRTAMDGYFAKLNVPTARVWTMPDIPEPNARVVTPEEFQRIVRYCTGNEFYDAATKTWSDRDRNGWRAGKQNLHLRKMVHRMLLFGLCSASRGGRVTTVSWEQSSEHPYVDLRKGRFHRTPLGRKPNRRKRAPIVVLSPKTVALLRAMRIEDGPEARFCICGPAGRPYTNSAGHLFRRVLNAVGIGLDVRFHTIRHSVITHWLTEGVSPRAVAGTVGMTLQTLERHYDHCDDEEVQVGVHEVSDRLIEKGFARDAWWEERPRGEPGAEETPDGAEEAPDGAPGRDDD